MSVPIASIGLPVYNGIQYLEQAITSLLNQDFTDFELIISDNASTDGSYELACSFMKDPRVRVIRNDENIGAIRNAVKVLDQARGKYFFWAGADDCWQPAFLSRLIAELESHPEASVAMCATIPIGEDGEITPPVRFVESMDPGRMTPFQCALAQASPWKYNFFIAGVFRREVLQRLAPYYFQGGAPDRILLTHLALHSGFRYVDENLFHRRIRSRSHAERYPNESYGLNSAMGMWGDFAFLGRLLKSLLTSSVVPLKRKSYVPIIVFRFGVTRIGGRLRAQGLMPIGENMPPTKLRTALTRAYAELDRRKTQLAAMKKKVRTLRGMLEETETKLESALRRIANSSTVDQEAFELAKARIEELTAAKHRLAEKVTGLRAELEQTKRVIAESPELDSLVEKDKALMAARAALEASNAKIKELEDAKDRLVGKITALRAELSERDNERSASTQPTYAAPN